MTFLSDLSDILLAAGALGAAFYCMVLSRRLKRFTDLEKGVGGAVALLSSQVDDLDKTLQAAQRTAKNSVTKLEDVSARADQSAKHLELLVASLHSLPTATESAPPEANPFRARRTNANRKPS